MSSEDLWYVRGEGNQPAGPFSSEELLESWRAGRLHADTICWREGMTQWLPLGRVEPFASTVGSANVGQPAAAGTRERPAPRVGGPSPPSAACRPGRRRRMPSAWIGWAVGGGVAAICAIVAGAVMLLAGKPLGVVDLKDPAARRAGTSSDAGGGPAGAAALAGIIHDYAERLNAAQQSQSTEIQRQAAFASAVEELKAKAGNCGTVEFTGKVVEIIQEPPMLGGQTRDRWGISMDLPPEFAPLVRRRGMQLCKQGVGRSGEEQGPLDPYRGSHDSPRGSDLR